MIEPRFELTLCTERQGIHLSLLQRLASPFARMLWKSKRRENYFARLALAKELTASAQRCSSREELEDLLGHPKYAMAGTHFATPSIGTNGSLTPDRVEVYEQESCIIDIWFYDSRIIFITGAPMPDGWDFVSGVMDAD